MATRWFPDTCSCVVIYEPQEDGSLVCTEVENSCPDHLSIYDPQEHLEAVLELNRAKNVPPQET